MARFTEYNGVLAQIEVIKRRRGPLGGQKRLNFIMICMTEPDHVTAGEAKIIFPLFGDCRRIQTLGEPAVGASHVMDGIWGEPPDFSTAIAAIKAPDNAMEGDFPRQHFFLN